MKKEKTRVSLYDLDSQIADALDALDDGRDAEAIRLLDTLRVERRQKVDGIAAAIKSYELHADMTAEELKRLQARKKRSETKAEYLRAYLAASMLTNDERRIDSPRFTVLCTSRPPVLDIADDFDAEGLAKHHPDLIRVKYEPRRTELKKALEGGATVPGASLVDGGYAVVLR